ncbi:hypothetical protein H5410_003127 [Solanum commersonii]|uniref:Uncharacterized protein n=1 Tax=Solanum commersonii TaxID=4109 RepID=A0A9J6B490_SOLCO|nr:hypothetical protein H5410_003127 [Solanum commersonii]
MNRSESHSEPSISDLRHEVSSLKEEIRNIKSRLCIVETDILTNQVPRGVAFHDLESNQSSSHEDLDDNIGIDLPNINNDHLVETLVTNTAKMAIPFVPPPLTPAKAEPSIRPELTFQNKFTALADFPRLPSPTQPKLPKLLCPPQPKLINLRLTKLPAQEASSSSVQTKGSYVMKTPESFAQAVLPLMALNKEYENIDKTRRFYEAILIDTDSIEIENSRDANNYVQYSRFTIKKILDLFEWYDDHLHTSIALTMAHKSQTYNWYDYKAAWMNFIYLRPRHTWLPFLDGFTNGGTYLEELRRFFPNNSSTGSKNFKLKKESLRYQNILNYANIIFKERIQHLCKQIQVKGWVPKQPNTKSQEKDKSSSKKLSKAALKQKLKDAIDNLDDYDEDQIMKMIEDAASTESSSEDNGDMCNPKGL